MLRGNPIRTTFSKKFTVRRGEGFLCTLAKIFFLLKKTILVILSFVVIIFKSSCSPLLMENAERSLFAV